jgi:hypothetical protein
MSFEQEYKELQDKITEVITYCQPYTEMMWSAKIISTLLGGDFRDARDTANEYLKDKLTEL